MDCKTARLLLPFAGRELDAAEADALQAHLADCPECSAAAEAERALDERLGRAVRDVPVPDGLKASLLLKLRAERDAFYRRWVARAAGMAAAVLLVGWLGWLGWLRTLPEVGVDELLSEAAQQHRARPQQVDDWLQNVGGPHYKHPPQFDYDLLTAWGEDKVEGKRVPFLLFVRGEHGGGFAWARVYVLGDRRFNLKTLQEQAVMGGGSGPGGLQAKVLTHPTNERIVYVVVYTGPGPESFYPPKPQPARGVTRAALPAHEPM